MSPPFHKAVAQLGDGTGDLPKARIIGLLACCWMLVAAFAASRPELGLNAGATAAPQFHNIVAEPPPAGGIVVGEVLLVAENCLPQNQGLDPGETLTIRVTLRNTGPGEVAHVGATLRSGGGVTEPSPAQDYGTLAAGGGSAAREFRFTVDTSCGGLVTVTLALQSDATPLAPVAFGLPVGHPRRPIAENFDTTPLGAVPAGWTAAVLGPLDGWRVVNDAFASPPQAVHAPAAPIVSDLTLVGPAFVQQSAAARLRFGHRFDFEPGYDGGVLEIAIDGAAFVDILEAGGAFVLNGYTAPISISDGSALAGRAAWTGTAAAFVTSEVTLPPSAAGRVVQLRWRCATDLSVGGGGWWLDTITIEDGTECCTTIDPLPTIQPIPDQQTAEDTPTSPIEIALTDPGANPGALEVTATASDAVLFPPGSLTVSGTGALRHLTARPALNQYGNAIVTVQANDGVNSVSQLFAISVQPVNDSPTILAAGPLATDEDTTSGTLAVIVQDVDTPAASLTLAARVADEALVPPAGVFVSGSGESRSVRVTPTPDQSGTSTLVLETSDGTLLTSLNIELQVRAINDPPTLEVVAAAATDEDTPTAPIPVLLRDVDTPMAELILSGSAEDAALIQASGLAFSGTGAQRSLVITPAADRFGTTTLTVHVSDGAGLGSSAIAVTVRPVNDAPQIEPIAAQATLEDTATAPIAVVVSDRETPAAALSVTANSSNPALVPDANLALGGSGAARTLVATPASNQSGTATITVRVTDGVATSIQSFVLAVNAVNDAPTLTGLRDVLTSEDTPTGALAFTVADVETSAAALVVTATSSNPTLLPAANIALGGSGAARTIALTPAANQFGTSLVTVRVSDASAASSGTFLLSVAAVNDAPTISNIPDQAMDEDRTLTLSFSVGDVETPAAELTLSATSSDPALLSVTDITFGGSGTTRVVTFKPASNATGQCTVTIRVHDAITASQDTLLLTVRPVNDAPTISVAATQTIDEDAPAVTVPFTIADVDTPIAQVRALASSVTPALFPNAGLVIEGTGANRLLRVTPARDASGAGEITLTVNDEAFTIAATLRMTVRPVNDPPVIETIDTQTTAEDTPLGPVTVRITDVDTPAAQLQLAAVAVPADLVAADGFGFTGDGGERLLTITPAPDRFGIGRVTVTVSDSQLSSSTAFDLAVDPVNDPPAIAAPAAITLDEDQIAGPIAFEVADVDDLPAALEVTITSSDPEVIPPEGLVLDGNGQNRTLTIAPSPDRSGTAVARISATDGLATVTHEISIEVRPVNDPPQLTPLADRTIVQGTALDGLLVTLQDRDSSLAEVTVTAASSDQSLVPDSGLVLVGGEGYRALSIRPSPAAFGSCTIRLTARDAEGAEYTESFVLTVQRDTDRDGLPDAFETANGLNPALATDALLDLDGDEFTNLEEFLAGTAPGDPSDSLAILKVETSATLTTISFRSVPGRSYRVEAGPGQGGPDWTALADRLTGTGGIVRVYELGGPSYGSRFYRLLVWP